MYVCMYVCMYVRMYVCTYVCMYVCTYVRMYVCTYAVRTALAGFVKRHTVSFLSIYWILCRPLITIICGRVFFNVHFKQCVYTASCKHSLLFFKQCVYILHLVNIPCCSSSSVSIYCIL